MSADKILSMAGAYEREAIRPHVLGHFADMLLAVEGHPAMLFYLDNSASIGPPSVAGINATTWRHVRSAGVVARHTYQRRGDFAASA